LDARGIQIVALSSDTVEKTAAGMGKHGLRAVMLSDADMTVTDRYNLRNPKNFALKSGVIVPLAIPTTFLVDRSGVVRWIDQADDYQQRSDPDRVLAAIRAALDGKPTAGPSRPARPA
jgi:peroxiredoxin